MKEIFKSILGITFFVGLVQIFNSFVEVYAQDLAFMTSILNGMVFIIVIMGFVIGLKSSMEMLYKR